MKIDMEPFDFSVTCRHNNYTHLFKKKIFLMLELCISKSNE